MPPITISLVAQVRSTPQAMCAAFLDLNRWPEFKGYALLPGIRAAHFQTRTPNLVGSRIQVHNTDGSSHLEEIIAWDEATGLAVKFHSFSPPVQHLATHFIETWALRRVGDQTEATRTLTMYPKNWLGWLVLLPMSQLMRQAFARQLAEQNPE